MTVCFVFFSLSCTLFLFSLCYTFSARHFPLLAGLWVMPPFHFVFGFHPFVSPPHHGGSLRRVVMLVSLVLAPAFSFNSPFFVSPPPHADGTREGFDGGLSCHSTLFGGLSCRSAVFGGLYCPSAFFVSPPRHTGGTQQVFDGWFALL